MTLPVSPNSISLSQINVEFETPSQSLISLSREDVRKLARSPSGTISISQLKGKSYEHTFSFSGGVNVDLYTLAISKGWDGVSKVVATNTGAITSSSTSTPALNIQGIFPFGIEFTNASGAVIVGKGGNGGNGVDHGNGTPGTAGGPALKVQSPVSFFNYGIIGGGGGGGGGGGSSYNVRGGGIYGGGGGGGGIGGGTGGTIAYPGNPSPEKGYNGTAYTIGAGGRGATGSGSTGLLGSQSGGNGGYYGASGGTGITPPNYGGTVHSGGTGGAAGACISQGNSLITWLATGTRYGTINN